MVRFSLKSPLLFCSLILLVYITGLWGTSIPLTGDQKVYLSAALEMYSEKKWIIPTLFGDPNFLKPPFQYWATIVGWKVFGLSVFGAILPSVLALVTGSFLTFRISKKLDLEEPSLAAILFASTLGTMTYGSTAQMEIWIVLFLLGAWYAVLSSRLILAFVMVGIMAWVKGPLYPVLWTLSLIVWNWRVLKTTKFWFALTIGIGVGLSWYILAAQTHRDEMVRQFFYTENLGKLGTHQGSVLNLWSEFIFSLFPWGIILLVGAFQGKTRKAWKQNQKFYLSYSVVGAIFFTFFPYRVNSYLYFLTPVMAMLASEIKFEEKSKIKLLILGIYIALFVVAAFLLIQLYAGEWLGIEIVLSALAAFLVYLVGIWKLDWKYVAVGSLLFVNIVRVSAVQIGEKDVFDLKSYVASKPGNIAYYIESKDIWHEYGLISSALGQEIKRIYHREELDSFLAQGGSVIFQDDQGALRTSNLNCVLWQRVKRRMKFPIEKMLREGIRWGDAEVMRANYICSNK